LSLYDKWFVPQSTLRHKVDSEIICKKASTACFKDKSEGVKKGPVRLARLAQGDTKETFGRKVVANGGNEK
jgi:hypothetical protein